MKSRFDEVFEEPLIAEVPVADHAWIWRTAAVIGGIIVVTLFAFMLGSWIFNSPDAPIMLRGARVGQLQPGAAVVLEDVQVGIVEAVSIEDGRPVAKLKLKDGMGREIPDDSRFVVESLNAMLPGNIGVRILPTDATTDSSVQAAQVPDELRDDAAADLGGRSVKHVQDAFADDSVLPASTPKGMYLVIGVAVLVAAVGFGVSWKVATTSWFRYVAIAVAVAATGMLFYRGVISIDDVRGWMEWAMQAIRGGGDSPPVDVSLKSARAL